MAESLPRTTCPGRLPDIAARDDGHLIAYTASGPLGEVLTLRRFASRAALVAFCKDGSSMHAVVKDSVPACMVVNRNTQREDPGPAPLPVVMRECLHNLELYHGKGCRCTACVGVRAYMAEAEAKP
jgi:hypothetical protein